MKPEIKKLLILNLPYLLFVYLFDKAGAAVRLSPGKPKNLELGGGLHRRLCQRSPQLPPRRFTDRYCRGGDYPACRLPKGQEREKIPQGH